MAPATPNVILSGWILSDAIRYAIYINAGQFTLVDIMTSIGLMYLGLLVLSRPAPIAIEHSVFSNGLALLASIYPFIFVLIDIPYRSYTEELVNYAIQIVATLLLLASMVGLGKNFSLFPQLRNISKIGPYRFARHPMYASYLLFDATLWLPYLSSESAVLWALECVLLYLRAKQEERYLLENSEAYRDYCKRVKYMFVWGVM